MYEVKLDNDTVSLADINECIAKLEEILSSGKAGCQLLISANLEIVAFDPLLVAYILAYHARIVDLKVTISLLHNSSRSSGRGADAVYQLYQYRTFSYVCSKRMLYDLVFKDKTIEKDKGWELSVDFGPGTFVFSSKFFPVLLVNDNIAEFNRMFRTSLSEHLAAQGRSISQMGDESLWVEDNADFRSRVHTQLRKISSPKDPDNAFLNLAQMYFIHSLGQARIASAYFEKDGRAERRNAKVGELGEKDGAEYLRRLSGIFAELENSTIFHNFMFATLISDDGLRPISNGGLKLNRSTYLKWAEKIGELWEFTKDLVAGIVELAKNIMEHAAPEAGAISVRVMGLDRWIQIKKGMFGEEGIYDIYRKRLESAEFTAKWSLVDVNVIDLGRTGIVRKLIDNTSRLAAEQKPGTLKQLLDEDRLSLEQNKITLDNFLDPSKRQLNQQSKRSIAHFGLLTLSRLVTLNDGLIACSSIDANDSNVREQACFPNLGKPYSPPVAIGTNYQIVIPVRKKGPISTNLPHNISLPLETTALEIAGIEKLFDYELIDQRMCWSDMGFIPKARIKYLFKFLLGPFDVKTRDDVDPLFKYIAEGMEQIVKSGMKKYAMCLDFDGVTIDESNLFRLHGMVELHYPASPVVIYNLDNTTFERMVKVNDEFHLINSSLDYWNAKLPTLVYSFIEVREKRFNFCDVLFGATEDDFLHINYLTGFTSFNSTAMVDQEKMIQKFVDGDPFKITYPNRGVLFYNKNAVLPFELILKDGSGNTLFEGNTIVLLENELSDGEVQI